MAPPIKPQRTASLRDSKKIKSCPDNEAKTSPEYEAKTCPDFKSRSGDYDGKPSADCDSNDSGHGLSRSDSDKVSLLGTQFFSQINSSRCIIVLVLRI